jgi:hypothetical protein
VQVGLDEMGGGRYSAAVHIVQEQHRCEQEDDRAAGSPPGIL